MPLIAETGGQNAMIVDSSALPEQVVADVLASAFDSAGQRCSALRVLCLQEDIADRVLAMLKGAMAELAHRQSGSPVDRRRPGDRRGGAAAASLDHIAAHARGRPPRCTRLPLPDETRHGTFVPPTLIEIDAHRRAAEREVFGPVLHVLRYRREDLDALIVRDQRHRLRPDPRRAHAASTRRSTASTGAQRGRQLYVNRNMIGAVVGVQPFGGHGLSGTGPKAGGPLYVRRLLSQRPPLRWTAWRASWPVRSASATPTAAGPRARSSASPAIRRELRGPATTALAPPAIASPTIRRTSTSPRSLFAGSADELRGAQPPPGRARRADRAGPSRTLSAEFLIDEVSLSVNTAAAGGNASLMAIG